MNITSTLIRKIKHFRLSSIHPSRVALYIVITALVMFTALPIVYVITTAFKPLDEILHYPPLFFAHHPTTKNFSDLVLDFSNTEVPFLRYVANSVFVSVVTVVGTVIVCSMGAFALTKIRLPYSNAIFSLIVATLMFSAPVAQLTNYFMINAFHMMNTQWALIIPKLAGSLYIFLLKQYFGDIPNALLEAAKIDGCSYWGLYAKMVIPITKPALATAVVFAFVNSWNDSTSPLLYLQTQALKTLPYAMSLLQGGAGQVAQMGAQSVGTLIMTLPTIIVFVAMQAQVIKTMAFSGIK